MSSGWYNYLYSVISTVLNRGVKKWSGRRGEEIIIVWG